MDAELLPTKTCTKCGETKPATTEYFSRKKHYRDGLPTWCKDCERNYRAANKEKISEYNREYHAANKEKKRGYMREWYAVNKEKISEQQRKYRAANKEKISEQKREYCAANREKRCEQHREYLRTPRGKELDRIKGQRRRARKRALPATFTAQDWQRALDYFGYCCAYCGRPQGLWHTLAQDHFHPVSKGGAFTPDNIVPACHGEGGCNNSKGNRDPYKWAMDVLAKNKNIGTRKAKEALARIEAYFATLASSVHE